MTKRRHTVAFGDVEVWILIRALDHYSDHELRRRRRKTAVSARRLATRCYEVLCTKGSRR